MIHQEDDDQQQNSPQSSPPNQEPQQEEYFLHSINSTISIRQLPSQGLSFQLWPAANTLFNLLDNINSPLFPFLTNEEDTPPRPLRILELGSGTGLVGIAAAAILGANVTLTDLPHVLPNLQFNIDANTRVLESRGGSVKASALSWGNNEEMEAIGREFDIILASDVVYHDHLYDPLLQTLRYLMLEGEKPMLFLMAHLKRWKKESTFFKKANKIFDSKIVYNDVPCNGSRIGVNVYHFVRKSCRKIVTTQ